MSSDSQPMVPQQPSFIDTPSPVHKHNHTQSHIQAHISPITTVTDDSDHTVHSPDLNTVSSPDMNTVTSLALVPSSSIENSVPAAPIVSSRPTRATTVPKKYSGYTNLPPAITKNIASSTTATIPEPKFYHQAVQDPNWCKAM